MSKFWSTLISGLTTTVFNFQASAGCEIDVSNYVGWSIVHAGTVTGFVDPDGKESDDYEGCEFGRKLIIDYDLAVTCNEYTYSYAFMPEIVVLVKDSQAVACIDDEEIDIYIE